MFEKRHGVSKGFFVSWTVEIIVHPEGSTGGHLNTSFLGFRLYLSKR
jgi:hypothetical protein